MSAKNNAGDGHVAAHPEPNYIMIWVWLAVLTVLEVVVVIVPGLPHAVVAVALVGMALLKAALVAAYFMHLRFEAKTLAMIASVPLVLCTFLLLMLLPDAM